MEDVVPQPPPGSNRGLWILVISLGIAILVVIAAMIGLTVRRAMYPTTPATPAQAVSAVPTPPSPAEPASGETAQLNLELDKGASIAEVTPDGQRLIVRITAPQYDEILVLDPAQSKVISRVRFTRKAP